MAMIKTRKISDMLSFFDGEFSREDENETELVDSSDDEGIKFNRLSKIHW